MSTNITATMVKELREQTGAGMMDCKAALSESGGNFESAVDWLRKKGLSKAAKKAGRVAAEGLVGVALAAGKGMLVEVNSETDFVARNDHFKEFVTRAAQLGLEADGDTLLVCDPVYGTIRCRADGRNRGIVDPCLGAEEPQLARARGADQRGLALSRDQHRRESHRRHVSDAHPRKSSQPTGLQHGLRVV